MKKLTRSEYFKLNPVLKLLYNIYLFFCAIYIIGGIDTKSDGVINLFSDVSEEFSLFDANNKFIMGHNLVTKFAEMFYNNIKGA